MPRILQETIQVRHPEPRLLGPARRAGALCRTDRPSELRIRRKSRDQQLNPALETEQRLSERLRLKTSATTEPGRVQAPIRCRASSRPTA